MTEQNSKHLEILDRILKAVEKDEKRRWVEIVCTVLLSVATVVSAWCVYQSTKWNGAQYFRIEDFNRADRQRLQKEIETAQRRAFDAFMFISFAAAYTDGDEKLANYLRDHFPPHLKKAALAWRATNPLKNPSAPRSPFEMKEYVIPQIEEAKKYADEAAVFQREAAEANKTSDIYILLSLILAMVLFFSGLSGVTKSHLNQKILLGTATAIFLAAIIYLLHMPVLL